jgi:hypothetical protein
MTLPEHTSSIVEISAPSSLLYLIYQRAMEPSYSSKDDVDESKGKRKGKGAQTEQFQFINSSGPSESEQARNRTLARSHTSTVLHRAQRKTREEARRQGRVEFTFVEGNGVRNASSSRAADPIPAAKLDRRAKRESQFHDMVEQFIRSWSPNSARISETPAMESTIGALQTYEGNVIPGFRSLLWECKAFATIETAMLIGYK